MSGHDKLAPVVQLFAGRPRPAGKSLGVGKPKRVGFTHHDVRLLMRAYASPGMRAIQPEPGEKAAARRCERAGWLFEHGGGYVLDEQGYRLVDKILAFLEHVERG